MSDDFEALYGLLDKYQKHPRMNEPSGRAALVRIEARLFTAEKALREVARPSYIPGGPTTLKQARELARNALQPEHQIGPR
jgi:hypothetical protein